MDAPYRLNEIKEIVGSKCIRRLKLDVKQPNEKTMKKIAVLMATYNGERFVSEQIESILQQK